MKALNRSIACIALLAVCGGALAQEKTEKLTVSFSDPSRPGVLNVDLVAGNITVKGGSGKDVVIESLNRIERMRPDDPDRAPGLRRLTQQPSLTVEEQDNRMKIESPHVNRPVDLVIQVPARTNLDLSTVNGSDIHVEGVEGEMEIGNVNGSITLVGVSGSVVAHTVNGKVLATLTQVTPQKPMAFTSLNGAVDVTLPASIKANLKLRSDNKSVYTDFDIQVLPLTSAPVIEDTRRSGGRYRIEVNKMIHGTVNGGGPDIEMRTFNGNVFVRKGS